MKVTGSRFVSSSVSVEGKPALKLPEFAFIGRSNVGKSSLVNMICGNSRLAMTSSTPGKTRVVNHFSINEKWYLVDLPGYGYAKGSNAEREAIAEVIRDYIMNSRELAMLFVLVDCRHDIGRIDTDFIAELGEHGIPFAIIYTKCDKLGPNALEEAVRRDEEILLREWDSLPPQFCCSSVTGVGREEVLGYIEQILNTI